jgi:hypothetical protein
MKKITNPNEIVGSFVSDYLGVFGNDLECVLMYGSAVTHEYQPGKSDINMAVILENNGIPQIARCKDVQHKWRRFGVATPFFMTKSYIASSLDTYPIEFLDMQSNYRILHGEDILANIEISREHLRLQCERELKGAALHIRKAFIGGAGSVRVMNGILRESLKALFPIFKALLVLDGQTIPRTKSDILSGVEDLYNMGSSVLSEIYYAGPKDIRREHERIFDRYAAIIDLLVDAVDRMTIKRDKPIQGDASA